MTDAQRLWVMLRDAGELGVHSHDIRKAGISGNPSQRAKDIVSHGQAVWTAREPRGKRPGSRYWLADFAPDWATPVKPNHDLNVEPAPDPLDEVAIVRDWDGEWRELPVSQLRLEQVAADLSSTPPSGGGMD